MSKVFSVMAESRDVIVLVEDDLVDRRAILRSFPQELRKLYSLEEVSSGEELFALCERFLPACVLLDHNLPGDSGVEILQKLSRYGPAGEIAVLLLTGDQAPSTISSAFRAGAYDYLHKSDISEQRLLQSITFVLERAHAARERRLSQENLQSALHQAVSATKRQQRLLGTISHEVRNPLTGLVGLSKLINPTGLSERDARYLELMKQSSRDTLALVDDLLAHHAFSPEARDASSRLFSVREAIEYPFHLLSMQRLEKDIEVSLSIDPAVPTQLFGFETGLKQVLLNLVSNAIKFSPKGGRVFLQASSAAQIGELEDDAVELEFSVRDEGIGIPQESIEGIFEAFSAASKTTRESHGGNGLGLSIVRELVTLLGGEITVESTSGKGTSFRFRSRFLLPQHPQAASGT